MCEALSQNGSVPEELCEKARDLGRQYPDVENINVKQYEDEISPKLHELAEKDPHPDTNGTFHVLYEMFTEGQAEMQ